MKKKDIKIGKEVFAVIYFGDFFTGQDIQAIKYEVGFIGKDSFIPADYRTLNGRYTEIEFDDCYETLEEIKKLDYFKDYNFEKVDNDCYNIRKKEL